jgi:hypothetical protein
VLKLREAVSQSATRGGTRGNGGETIEVIGDVGEERPKIVE